MYKSINFFVNPFASIRDYAMVVIDMQPSFLFGSNSMDRKDRKQVDKVCLWQEGVIQDYRMTSKRPVIFVEYDNGFGKFGDSVLGVRLGDIKIKKGFDDATLSNLFSNIQDTEKPNDLVEVLNRLSVNDVAVLGCNADACVLDTIASLRQKKFEVHTSREGLLSQGSDPMRLEYAITQYQELGAHILL
ncbi:MAG: isochorismatase family protein [Nanoarchaeota archaeon]|nr:isochorismatase family protein [Nanoarchaeota archaeon]